MDRNPRFANGSWIGAGLLILACVLSVIVGALITGGSESHKLAVMRANLDEAIAQRDAAVKELHFMQQVLRGLVEDGWQPKTMVQARPSIGD
jgi:hypothetical protein